MKTRMHRRQFLRQSTLGGTGFLILNAARSAWTAQANEKLNVALVGVGGRGGWFVATLPKLENVVAICDVNDQKADEAFRHWENLASNFKNSPRSWEQRAAREYERLLQAKPKVFRDFRKMLDTMEREIDAVVIATPDHSHAVASAAAIRAGKGVFCEKPLTRTVHESHALRELARQHKVATAMGNQGTYSGAFRRALELIRNGTIGDIKEVHVWNSGGGADKKAPPQGKPPVPDYLDWNLWLGPAADRPYHPEWMQRHSWREFGTSQLGNWGSHSANLGFMALKVHELWLPPNPQKPASMLRLQAKCSNINRLSFPRWEQIQYEVPARAEYPPITIHWYNGESRDLNAVYERAFQGAGNQEKGSWRFAGTLIAGTKGSIHTTGHNMWFRLLPADQFQGIQTDRPEAVEASRDPQQDWVAACRGGKAPWSNFDYADALNEFLMLGNVATHFEGPLEFDPLAMKIRNNTEADALLRAEYRNGWTL
ncbi:MAG: Gfo/Idh/MocA family oxidoreductase [Verrucomicrobia bacterium]|nr:Gfo/Idh/MocA family oxidoreductase [Verrucomicrobiota bacterium]